MKIHLSFLLIGLFVFNLTAQNKSVEKLKEAQDKRRSIFSSTALRTDRVVRKTAHVNPFIGTGGHGHTYPGASAPFGMMQLSPDTRFDGWDGCSGYHYSDSILYGFSHTHLSGTGVSDYGDLLICPQVGSPKTEPLYKDKNGYGHVFKHTDERASPGYYAVELRDQGIKVALTTSTRSGMHKYNFSDQIDYKYVIIDLDHRDQLISSDIQIVSTNSLKGHRVSNAWATEQHFYFFLETNVPWISAKRIEKNGRHKLLLKFQQNLPELLIKVGMSAVDEMGAETNLMNEIPHWNFDLIKSNTAKLWEDELSKINLHSKDPKKLNIFYTALYHSYLQPNVFSDIDGRYRGHDGKIHTLLNPNQTQYTVFSLWDTFRAAHPLYTITQTGRTKEFIETFERMNSEGGDLPVWELAGNETECMIGYHSVSVIADAYTKGIKSGNEEEILRAMMETSKRPDFAKDYYSINGYISLNKEPESVSKALEYAYDDYCIARYAESIGKMEIAQEYHKRSLNFINHYDPSTGFFRARRSGLWFAPFVPEEVNFNYTEANAWHYSLFAPHAIGVLEKLHGGKAQMLKHLDRMFEADTKTSGRDQADITGLIGQYAHGNEPSHHMAYLYNYLGRPDKAQFYIDRIFKEMYQNAPDGLSGNEDCGQMSSWYVLSSIGIYQVSPGSAVYDLGRPICDSAEVNLENGIVFKVVCYNQDDKNPYVQNIKLNGRALNRTYISHNELNNGGLLEFEMGELPNKSLESYEHAPTISTINENFVPVPFFKNSNRVFEKEMIVYLAQPIALQKELFKIEYKLNDGAWKPFEKPFVLIENAKIEARTVRLKSNEKSAAVMAEYVKHANEFTLKLNTDYANQYAAGGQNALIDGIKGENEYRTGDWQGYYGKDLNAELTFLEPKQNFNIELGLLEDLKSWIFFPSQILIEISEDGKNFKKYKTLDLETMAKAYAPSQMKNVNIVVNSSVATKAIRIAVKNPGNCPVWHLGAGYPTWIFLDEISITNL